MELFKGKLRAWLRDHDPELHGHLDRSCKTAVEEWLPYIKAKDSTNGLPHLTAIERQLDALLMEDTREGPKLRTPLEPVEIYVLLAVTLLHDLDKAVSHPEIDGQVQGEGSQEYINKNWARLGLASKELAEEIGRICAVHDHRATHRGPSGEWTLKTALRKLHPSRFIFPRGSIRTQSLAAIFHLADRLDDGHSRVLPDFLWEKATDVDPVGLFRSVINGVYVDHENRMILTCLGSLASFGVQNPTTVTYKQFVATEYCGKASTYALIDPKAKNIPLDDLAAQLPWKNAQEHVCESLARVALPRQAAAPLTFIERCAACHELRLEPTTPKPPSGWPPSTILAIVMGSVCGAGHDLQAVAAELEAMGLPFDAWLIEYEGRLFTAAGAETWEPTLDKPFLKRTAAALVELWTRSLDGQDRTYDNLSRALNEAAVSRTKLAVRRLAVMLEDGDSRPVLPGQANWRLDPVAIRRRGSLTLQEHMQDLLEKHLRNAKEPSDGHKISGLS